MITDDMQNELRSRGIIASNEVLKKEGDLYYALNVLTQERRIIKNSHVIGEVISSSMLRGQKKVLKG